MGGLREEIITVKSGSLGIHEEATTGLVHIHDDAKGAKFICNLSDFKDKWAKAKDDNFSIPFEISGQNKQTAKFIFTHSNGQIDINIEFIKPKLAVAMEAISRFLGV